MEEISIVSPDFLLLNRTLCRFGVGRCEFFLHKGSYSEGCITVDKGNEKATTQWSNLMEMLKNEPQNNMTVIPHFERQ